jgi:hypothetical protein
MGILQRDDYPEKNMQAGERREESNSLKRFFRPNTVHLRVLF